MASFFDNLANKAKNMSNQLSDKARDSSEHRRLESEIRQINQEIEKIYTSLGRGLYESRVNGQPEEFDEAVTRITELKALIDGKNSRIEELRSQIVCPNCGRLMPAGTTYCLACGRPMVKPEEPEIPAEDETVIDGDAVEIHERRCPNCGAVVAPDAVFCLECGTPLEAPEGGEAVQEAPEDGEAAQEAPESGEAAQEAPEDGEAAQEDPE